jgi:hypothetical protein
MRTSLNESPKPLGASINQAFCLLVVSLCI